MTTVYDIAFLGHQTKDTMVSAIGTRVVDGGAFNYGAQVAARMGLKVAAITRVAKDDFRVDVFARDTPQSTCLRLEYSTSNVDERVIYVESTAGPFTPAEVEALRARAILVGASMRGEVSLRVIEELRKKDTLLTIERCKKSYAGSSKP